MGGNSDSEDGGLWWLGGGSDGEPPPQERRTDRGATRPGNSSGTGPGGLGPLGGSPSGSILGNLSSAYPSSGIPSSSLGRAPSSYPPSSYPSLGQSQPLDEFVPSPPPPPPPVRRGKQPPRRRGGRNALAIITILIALAVIAALLWHVEAGNGYIGFGPAPTPTVIGPARKATVHFTRTTQTVNAPATFVAATTGGQVTAKQVSANATGASGAVNASPNPPSRVVFTINVLNNSSNSNIFSYQNNVVKSQDGKVTCTIEANDTSHGYDAVPPGQTIKEQCDEPFQQEPAESWHDSTDYSPLVYYTNGSTPAGGNPADYIVPSGCGSAGTAAEQDATNKLKSQGGLAPSGAFVFYGPAFNVNATTLTCNPAAGTQQLNPFTFTASVSGTVTETYALTSDIQSYQQSQLQKLVPAGYVLLQNAKICPDGPQAGGDATATHATITCAATGTAAWNWSADALNQLAGSIAGLGPGPAALQLNQTQGVVAGSVKISLEAGTLLPEDPAAIGFVITP